MKYKISIITLISLLSLSSCKEDKLLSSGQQIIRELQYVIVQNEVTEVQIRPLDIAAGGWPSNGQVDFSFQDESIRVNNRYYNINRLTEYWVNDYFSDQDKQIFVLVLVMDI